MSKKGGYKIVSLGGLDLTGENLALSGLYNALKISYGKPILLTGIVIDGEKMKDIYVIVGEDTDGIIIKHVYGYNLTVSDEDAITVEEDSENISLPVPNPDDDGKLLKVNVQGKYVLGNLDGKYVRIMDTPSSTTLTDEQIDIIKEGVFINGTFDGMKNPVLFPCSLYSGEYYGLAIYEVNYQTYVVPYSINSSKVFHKNSTSLFVFNNSNANVDFKGKQIPSYPSSTGTFTLKCVDGTLTWVQDQ